MNISILTMTKDKTPIIHRSDTDKYTVNAVVISKRQLAVYLGVSRYRLNKLINTPELLEQMGLTKMQYKYKREFSPAEFLVIRRVLQFSDEEVRDLVKIDR